MSAIQPANNQYGFPQPLTKNALFPIISNRVPTTHDFAPIGQEWVYVAGNQIYFLSSIVSNSATWILVAPGGGAGVFTSLTVNPGPTNLSTVGNGDVNIGNAANTGTITLEAGVGNLQILGNGNAILIGTDANANLITIGNLTAGTQTVVQGGTGTGVATAGLFLRSADAGDIAIGSITQTGAIRLGNSNSGNNIFIGNGSGATTVTVASGVAGNAILLGNGANTSTQTVSISNGASAANSTVNILSGNGTAGTQTLNMLTGTRAGAFNLGTGAAGNTGIIGSLTAASTLTLRGDATGASPLAIFLNAGGYVAVAPNLNASGSATPTLQGRVIQLSATGFTTAAAATEVITITNALAAVGSPILVTVSNDGSNDAQMTLQRVQCGVGTIAVTMKNNGAAALNGTIYICAWLLD